MSSAQAFAQLQALTPADAVVYLQRRDQLSVTYGWQDLWQEEHAQQFTVSRLTQADVLQALRDKITASVAGDLSRRDFMRDARSALAEAGWWGTKEVVEPATGEILKTRFDPSRLKLIFDVNTRQAYAAGQWEGLQRSKGSHPYLRYITKRDERVREAHRAWDNVTLPLDDGFWKTHYPPNGWRCRCRVVAVSEREYEQGTTPTGAPMVKEPPELVWKRWENRRSGQVETVPAGIDPGFGYNVGIATARLRQSQAVIREKLEALSPGIARATIKDLAQSAAFGEWLSSPKGQWPIGRIDGADAQTIGSNVTVVNLSDSTVKKQHLHHPEVSVSDYAQVQAVLDHARHKIQDGPNNLIYVLDQPSDNAGGYVVVVKATATGNGLYLTSLRRLSKQQAETDREVQRLLKKGGKS